jgi:hypothetical protein
MSKLKIGDHVSLKSDGCTDTIGKLVCFDKNEPRYGHKYKLLSKQSEEITYCTHGLTKIKARSRDA